MNPFNFTSFMKPHPALRPSGLIRLIGLFLALCLPVVVAAPLPQTSWLATVGTSWRQPSGQDWAYLLYQSSDGTALAGRTVAVYRKDGEPNSPALFTRQAVTRLQDNPAVIAPLLDRSVNVGEDLNELADHVTGLFQSLIPAPAVSLPERLAAVVQGLNADPSLHSRVLLLSRRHPGAALAFGMAWTEPLPAGIPVFTYELRDHDPVSGTDRAVVARVTIRPGAALVLPAPGIAVDVPTNSPQADLLARLRWSTPDPLRRLAPAQMGFNVYRIPTPIATALGFTTNPPAAGVLATLARQAAGVERVNEQPVVPPKEYSATDVANFAADPTTVFITDDRARFRGGPGFVDGDRFCYFVAARDILGRDGQYSPALCVTICDRVPPSAPRSVKVSNDYLIEGTAGVQRLKVQWQPADGATGQRVARYAIFRWDDRNQMHEDGGKALPIGFVDHRPGTNKYLFIDRSPTAPTVAKDAGKVFWYTVRAVQDTACGPLVSPDSAPARGIPRDRVGPSGSPPNLTLREPVPTLTSQPILVEGGGLNLAENARRFVLRAVRESRDISWVEITVLDTSFASGAATIGRHYFPPVVAGAYGSHATATTFNSMEWNYVSTNKAPITNIVTFGLANGLPSRQFVVVAPPPPVGNFAGGVQMNLSLGWTNVPAGPGHTAHYPRDLTPEKRATGVVTGVPIDMTVSVDARQWRIYRKLDDGPMAMIAEGNVPLARAGRSGAPAADAQIAYEDDSMPVNTASARYYSQYLDADGNAGPMFPATPISISTPPPPASALSLIPGDGGTNDPSSTMTLVWSAAPYGTARYRIWIGNPARVLSAGMIPVERVSVNTTGPGSGSGRAAQPATAMTTPLQMPSTYPILPVVYRDFVTEAGITNLPCSVIDTTIVGGRVGVGPVYSNLLARATVSADLYVQIEPVALDGTVGASSSTLVLRAGTGNVSTNPAVPWPRRPLPPARSNFTTGTPGFAAVRIRNGDLNGTNNADFNGIGVAIGKTTVNVKSGSTLALGRNAWINGSTDPDSLLFKDPETDVPILGQVITTGSFIRPPGIEMPVFLITQPTVSAVLYRQQVPSAAFPQPPGDMIQVTPMIDGIEHNAYTDPVTAPPAPVAIPGTRLNDPFVGLFPYGTGQGLFLLDTQPIISGATYQYFLVRFDEYGEMIEVLPTNPVTANP